MRDDHLTNEELEEWRLEAEIRFLTVRGLLQYRGQARYAAARRLEHIRAQADRLEAQADRLQAGLDLLHLRWGGNNIEGNHGPEQQATPGAASQVNGNREAFQRVLHSGYEFHPGGSGMCFSCSKVLPLSRLVEVPCYHRLCDKCLIAKFERFVTDQDQFLPRCCDKYILPHGKVFQTLPKDLIERFFNKEEELTTWEGQRVYCRTQGCHTYLPRRGAARNKVECPNCGTIACLICKKKLHDNRLLTRKGGLPGLLRLAGKAGQVEWQRCSVCRAIVERSSTGCFFMGQWFNSLPTTRCGYHLLTARIACPGCKTDFCYICGADWKTCYCPTTLETPPQVTRPSSPR